MSSRSPAIGKTADQAIPFGRLDLTTGQSRYAIERLTESLVPNSSAFRLVKGEDTTDGVARTPFGPQCACPDYLFRREGLDPSECKHLKALTGSGLMDRAIQRRNLAMSQSVSRGPRRH